MQYTFRYKDIVARSVYQNKYKDSFVVSKKGLFLPKVTPSVLYKHVNVRMFVLRCLPTQTLMHIKVEHIRVSSLSNVYLG